VSHIATTFRDRLIAIIEDVLIAHSEPLSKQQVSESIIRDNLLPEYTRAHTPEQLVVRCGWELNSAAKADPESPLYGPQVYRSRPRVVRAGRNLYSVSRQ
jgi:hypothetical protein